MLKYTGEPESLDQDICISHSCNNVTQTQVAQLSTLLSECVLSFELNSSGFWRMLVAGYQQVQIVRASEAPPSPLKSLLMTH